MTNTIQGEQIIRKLRRTFHQIFFSQLSISGYTESVEPVYHFSFNLHRDIQTLRQMYNFPATSSEFL